MQSRFTYFKGIINRNSEAILIFLLIIFFLTEAVSKISISSNMGKSWIQAGIKALVFGLILIGLFIYKKKELLYIFILAVLFSIGQVTIFENFEFPIVTYFLKYIFPIAFFGFFTIQPRAPKLKLLNAFEYLLLFNSVVILIGFIFEIQIFRSYSGIRFGYNGLLVTSAASTYFYIIGMCCFLVRYQKGVLKNWKFWFIVVAGLIVGTKAIALALIAIGFFYIINYVSSKLVKWGLIVIVFSVALSFGYFLFFINPTFQSLRESHGILTSFLSLRDQLFMEQTLPYIQENWGFWNYLFGGVSNFELRPQMELVDIVFFWGLIGSFCYAYFYLRSYLQFKFQDVLTYFILILLLIITILAGNFFYNASVVIYLAILREAFVLFNSRSSPE